MVNEAENSKRIARNTFLLYVRMFFMMGISLYTSRVVLAALGESDFGIYNVVGGFVLMFSFISGAMATATQRFLSFEIGKDEEGNVRSLFSAAVIIHVILSIIILILAETVGLWFLNNQMNFPSDRYNAANWVFQFSVITFMVNVISVPYNAAIIAYEKMAAFAYVSIVEAILKLLVVYLLVISSFDSLILYAVLLAFIAIMVRVIYGVYCSKIFTECRCDWKWNKEYGGKMMAFVSWNLIGSTAEIAKEQGVNVVLNIFFGATVNAARGVAYQVLIAIRRFVDNFQMAMKPQIVKLYASDEKSEMFRLVFNGSKLSFLMLLTLSLPVMIEAPFILNLWLKNVPDYTVIFLRLILISVLIDSLSGTLIASMHASGKVRDFQIIVGGISLLTLPLVYIFFKLGYPPYTAMYIGIVISVCCHFARLILLNKSIGFPVGQFLREVTFKVLLVSLLSIILPLFFYLLLNINWSSFFLVCCLSVLSTFFFSFYLALNANERDFVRRKIRTVIDRKKK